ncbi:MAG: DUF4249 family protein [Bacteroidetes bacterium]|nr:DUF4249 family protein [Bacteroidota bacterium]
MKFLYCILPLLLLVSCEQIVNAPDWPAHEEKLAITATLHIRSDTVFTYARVSRTQALDERFDRSATMIHDAEVQLQNGERMITLTPHRQERRSFYHTYNYSAITQYGENEDYDLTVRYGEKTATSAVRVRRATMRFTDVRLEYTEGDPRFRTSTYTLYYSIPAPQADTHTECTIMYWSPDIEQWMEIHNAKLPPRANRDDGMLEGSIPFFARTGDHVSKLRFRYILISRNSAYMEHYHSRWVSDSPFDSADKNPRFNIGGDGIGFFMYEIIGDPVEIIY